MYTQSNLSFRLLYTGYYKVGTWWNFPNLTSSFYRLFLITKGNCTIKLDSQKFDLKEGDIFLVPKLVKTSYCCENYMEHYYICLLDGEYGSISISEPSKLFKKASASDLDRMLFQRLAEISRNRSLPSVNPDEYDNKKDLFIPKQVEDIQIEMEQRSIIALLFSRFITEESISNDMKKNASYSRISHIIRHIEEHLSSRITIAELADIMCTSPDHFTKLFKKTIGMPPAEFIKLKRVEKASTLLATTSLSIQDIAESIGIENASQFSKFFHKNTGMRPGKFRKQN